MSNPLGTLFGSLISVPDIHCLDRSLAVMQADRICLQKANSLGDGLARRAS